MEEKRREAAAQPSSNSDSPASEPASSRRKGGAQKRKANVVNASNSSSTPSKRITREKASPVYPPMDNGPLTRARQIPNDLAAAASPSAASGGGADSVATPVKQWGRSVRTEALGADLVAAVEAFNKETEWEALEAAIEAEFEAIKSGGTNVHVVPSHCGWFSWVGIHPIEMHTLPSFFNGKTENRTSNTYMEIRNWVIKRFHENPNVQIELKDLLELNVGDLDARQEVMEFLDHWGLINFQPVPSMDSAVASADDDGDAEKISLVENFYHFLQLCTPIVPKKSIMTPGMPSGLFPESTFAEELLKEEGPSVEYHCNACSADCSRKRYHCQKQADFDLCTGCFSNRKFGSGMSASDFILMEPAEVPGVSGGKWTDQETLLLLEALELYKENWNEIAEHVATKTKAQCILHFVQMPIEDAFLGCNDDDINASCKETADLTATTIDSSVLKDASEINGSKTSDGGEGQVLNPCNETSRAEDADKVEVDEETPKPEDASQKKTSGGTSISKDATDVKSSQEVGDEYTLKVALNEAFEAVGYSPEPEGPASFAEVGNPALAMAVFLAHLVGPDIAVASAHSSLKSLSGNSPSIELAGRHCFHLEGPPDDKKEPTSAKRKVHNQDGKNEKQDNSMLDGEDLSNDLNDQKIESNAAEDYRQMNSTNDGASEKVFASKDQAIANNEEAGLDNNNLELPSDQAQSTIKESDGSTSKAEIPPSSEESKEATLVQDSCFADEVKDGHVMSKSLPAEKNELQQSVTCNPEGEHLHLSETPKEAEMVSDSVLSDKSKPQELPATSSVGSSQHTGTEKAIDMMSSSVPLVGNESSHLLTANSGAENRANAGEDCMEVGMEGNNDGIKTKHGKKFEKVIRAAVSTLAAAAVKAKLLANKEEKQIGQLATLLIEKQLLKLETKLAFFNEVERVVTRLSEHLDRSRQMLYHERALIIASRFGLPASSSRCVPPSLRNIRIPMNFANSVPRPPISMYPQRPPISRPMGSVFNTLSNPLASTTAEGNSVRPI